MAKTIVDKVKKVIIKEVKEEKKESKSEFPEGYDHDLPESRQRHLR